MTDGRTLAVMQPYIFPAMNYFQLVGLADHFVFYDDVGYVKGGWINRNRIQQKGREVMFTVPVSRGSVETPIMDVPVIQYPNWRKKFLKTLTECYSSAPNFTPVFDLVNQVLEGDQRFIADIAVESIVATSRYLGLDIEFSRSSVISPDTKGIGRTERLFYLCEQSQAKRYVNSIGGRELYDVETFAAKEIELKFLQPVFPVYKQSGADFIPMLSIIDVMMYLSLEEIRKALAEYTLVS